MRFKREEWDESSEPIKQDRVIARVINEDGITVTCIGTSASAVVSEETPYDVIEMPDGLEFIVAISDDYIHGLLHNIEEPFDGGFAFGLFIGQVATQVLYQAMEEC